MCYVNSFNFKKGRPVDQYERDSPQIHIHINSCRGTSKTFAALNDVSSYKVQNFPNYSKMRRHPAASPIPLDLEIWLALFNSIPCWRGERLEAK
jgi:hypothetical protein